MGWWIGSRIPGPKFEARAIKHNDMIALLLLTVQVFQNILLVQVAVDLDNEF